VFPNGKAKGEFLVVGGLLHTRQKAAQLSAAQLNVQPARPP